VGLLVAAALAVLASLVGLRAGAPTALTPSDLAPAIAPVGRPAIAPVGRPAIAPVGRPATAPEQQPRHHEAGNAERPADPRYGRRLSVGDAWAARITRTARPLPHTSGLAVLGGLLCLATASRLRRGPEQATVPSGRRHTALRSRAPPVTMGVSPIPLPFPVP
jgi:hypothetical protein